MACTFIRISNADGKAWVLPTHNMRMALHLYQPGAIKGKLLKKCLPFLWRLPLVCRFLHIEKLNPDYSALRSVLDKVFGLQQCEIALFEGTPCAHQKTTIQVFQGDKIYGYAKISSNPAVVALFENEKKVLERLHELEITNVPRCLALTQYIDDAGQSMTLFAQDTRKTASSILFHDWNMQTYAFLSHLESCSWERVPFSQTAMYEDICAVLSYAPAPLRVQYERLLAEYEQRLCDCCICHNDFTPWNMYIQDGQLEVFDWEYASLCNPCGLDKCHFLFQTAIFEKKYDADTIVKVYIAGAEQSDVFRMYLLAITAKYLRRDPSCVEDMTMKIWMQIIAQL